MARKKGENCAKAWRKSSHIDRYEHGERSMLVFISTVMNMRNDRYETIFNPFSMIIRLVLE